MATGDIDMTVRFWRDLLGMRLVAGIGSQGFRHYFLQIDGRDLLAFFEWPGVKAVERTPHGQPVEGPFIFDHVSFGVESEEDLCALKDKIAAAGFWASGVIDHGLLHSIYAYDPNGIPIEFSADVPGRDVREHPVFADQEPPLTATEGTAPVPGHWPEVPRTTPVGERRIHPMAGSCLFGKATGEHPV